MKCQIIWVFFFVSICFGLEAKRSKIIGLMAGRNEEIFIEQALRSLSLYTDSIIFLDDASTDNTVEIVTQLANECNIEKIIRKKKWFRDEPGDRNLLLKTGRKYGGTHFVIMDADEMFTANCLNDNFLRQKILELQPGDFLLLNWIQLWRSVDFYRYDNSVWSNNYKYFAFCDNRICSYESDFIHTKRLPSPLRGEVKEVRGYEYGVLHFQYVNWENLLIKQAWYKCLEHIRIPEKSVTEINERYAPSIDESGLGVEQSPYCWFSNYSFLNGNAYMKPENWRKKQMQEWFVQYGIEYFKDLDIWDIDWSDFEVNI